MESLQSVNAENASKSKRTLRKPSRFDVPPPAKTSATSPRPAASPASAPELRRAVARRNSEGETYVPGTNSTKLIGTILPQLAMYSEVHLYRKDIQAVDGDEESVTWTIEEVPRRFGSSHNAPSSFVPTVASTKMRINHYPRHHVPGIPVHSDELQQASESPITPPPELANNQENDYASQLFEKILPKLTMYSEIHLSVKETKFGSNGGAAISWNVRLVKDDCES
uniref:MHD domain-containing protein n=1 Tax=Steinernema glaseri TaxID=37863 RepID=A0A1I7ZRK0_9BILA